MLQWAYRTGDTPHCDDLDGWLRNAHDAPRIVVARLVRLGQGAGRPTKPTMPLNPAQSF
jgi:hypothetical protein